MFLAAAPEPVNELGDFVGIAAIDGKPGLLQGNLGTSWVTSQPVAHEIRDALPVTLEIVTYALLIAFAIALPMGLASARKPGGTADRVTLVWGLFAGAQPDYWWGLLFVFVSTKCVKPSASSSRRTRSSGWSGRITVASFDTCSRRKSRSRWSRWTCET